MVLEESRRFNKIVELASGEDAWTYLEKHLSNPPTLILLDLLLPGMSGWQFMDRMARTHFNAPYRPVVLIVTGQVTDAHRSLVHAYRDAVGICEKPLRMEMLNRAVQKRSVGMK